MPNRPGGAPGLGPPAPRAPPGVDSIVKMLQGAVVHHSNVTAGLLSGHEVGEGGASLIG